MLYIFKWECTINETCQGNFPWKYFYKKKKKHKIASPEKSTSSDEKKTALVFMLE